MAGRTGQEGELVTQLMELVEPLVSATGVELLDVDVKGHTGRRLIRLVIDAEGGVDVETCAALSRRVGSMLDGEDLISGAYTLQVTSPGADRPLHTGRDFARSLGRTVRVWMRPGNQSQRREVVGVVAAVDHEAVTLDVDGDAVRLALVDVDRGRVQLPW